MSLSGADIKTNLEILNAESNSYLTRLAETLPLNEEFQVLKATLYDSKFNVGVTLLLAGNEHIKTEDGGENFYIHLDPPFNGTKHIKALQDLIKDPSDAILYAKVEKIKSDFTAVWKFRVKQYW